MAAPVLDLASFFTAVSRAGVLSDEQMAVARQVSQGLSDPSAIARKLVNASLLSRWQANQILGGREDYSFGNYRLLDQVAVDAVGEVYSAQHISMGRRATIRLFGLARPFTAEDSSSFLREAQRIAALDHPHVVHVYDVDQVDDRYFMIMEDVSGADLYRQVTPNRGLAPAVAAEYVWQAAAGLAYVHHKGVIHGNLTPRQMVRVGDVIKIVDVALPELANCASLDGSAVVDADFVPPEKTLGRSPGNERSDIYSLGCTLFYLLVGRPPFTEGTRADRLRAHCEHAPPDIRKLRSDIPAELIRICQRMMAKNPAQRYAAAQQVVDALSQFLPPQKPLTATASAPMPTSTPQPAAPMPAAWPEGLPRVKPQSVAPGQPQPVQQAARVPAAAGEFAGIVAWPPNRPTGGTTAPSSRSKKSDETFTIVAVALLVLGLILAGGLFFITAVGSPVKKPVSNASPGRAASTPAGTSAKSAAAATKAAPRPQKGARQVKSSDDGDADFPKAGDYIGTSP